MFQVFIVFGIMLFSILLPRRGSAQVEALKKSICDSLQIVNACLFNECQIRVAIRKEDSLPAYIELTTYDELRGDQSTRYVYSNYDSKGTWFYPRTIDIIKFDGRLRDQIQVQLVSSPPEPPQFKGRPQAAYIEKEVADSMVTKQFADGIYFIKLLHTGSRTLVVEFSDYLLVAEAPLNSKNGELIINEVNKIAAGKTLRYFAFSHHHPDYIGGLRPFVRRGTSIISTVEDTSYLNYLVQAAHSLRPDALHQEPQPAVYELLHDSLVLSDHRQHMVIYHIGEHSAHTSDYTVFYFPVHRLLVQGDLVWIEKDAPIAKAGKRQEGLYHAIRARKLQVDRILQTWGTHLTTLEMDISFQQLETSVHKQ